MNFGPLAPLIHVDKDATRAVHDGFSSAQEFCAEIAMAGKQNSKRAQDQP
jgi:hypothetical protein